MPETLERYIRTAAARLTQTETPLLDARILARRALGLGDEALILFGDRPITETQRAAIDALIERRARGEPVAQIIGEKEFFGLTFAVAAGVLTPRPDSETLVEAVLARRDPNARLHVLDLGTGTGCLLCALLSVCERAVGVGVDINPDAVALARRNGDLLGFSARADFLEGGWEAAPEGPFDVIVSNPPYIPDDALDGLARDIREYEDPRALFGGPDGLNGYRSVLEAARRRIGRSGLIILELGAGQDEDVRALAGIAFPAAHIEVDADLAGRPRALVIDLGV